MNIEIVNIGSGETDYRGTPGYFYVGRGSAVGNPFRIGEDGTRDQVIKRYEEWFYAQLDTGNVALIREVNAMEDYLIAGHTIRLGCFCKPQACHGDIIKAYLEFRLNVPPAA